MFIPCHLILQINQSFEKNSREDQQLGSMAFQIDICTIGAGLGLVHAEIRICMVLHTEQSKNYLWWYGR